MANTADLGEETLLSDLGEGDVENLVARRHLLHDAELAVGKPPLQLGHHVVRLDLGQLRRECAFSKLDLD